MIGTLWERSALLMPTRLVMIQIQAVTCRKVLLTLVPSQQTGDCLTCLDTEEVAVNSAHKKFQKKVETSCSITKGCLWSEAYLK